MRSMKTFGLWLIILTRLASACPYLDALEQNSGQRKLQMHRQRRRHRAQKPSNPTVSQPPTASTEPQPPTSPTEPTSSDDRPQPTPSDDRPLPTGSEDLATLVANARANIVDILTNEPIFGPPILRLVFHDCVGGCDGCVDLSKGENNAVGFPMKRLQDACPGLSRADCWAIAAVTTAQQLNGVGFTFDLEHVGRRDCSNGDAIGDVRDSVDQPSASLTTDGLLDFFASEFGFDAQETVALMGAHTLGSLANGRTGFSGQWVTRPRVLDNEFFQLLTDGSGGATTDYDQSNDGNDNGLFTWIRRAAENVTRRSKRLIMLNVDMALVRDVSSHVVDQRTGEVSCALSDQTTSASPVCDIADQTFAQVAAYANDNQLWLEDFRDALTKMLVNGYDTSSCVPGTLCVLP